MKLSRNNLLALAVAASLLVLTAYTAAGDKKPAAPAAKSELLMVEIIFGFDGNEDVSGIYVTKNDGTVAKDVNLIGYVGKENIGKNASLIHKYLKATYAQGWELESSTGGDNSKRYLFRK